MESFPSDRALRGRRRPSPLALSAACTLMGGLSLLATGAHAQAPVNPTVVTVSPDKSAAQLAKTMNVTLEVAQQILAIDADKDARTPVQQKICSDFIYLARMTAGKPAVPGVPKLATIAQVDAKGCVKAVISLLPSTIAKTVSGPVTGPSLNAFVNPVAAPVNTGTVSVADAVVAAGGQVINDSGTSLVVNLPIAQVETIAALPAVGSIANFIPPRHVGRVMGQSIAERKNRPLVPYLRSKDTKDAVAKARRMAKAFARPGNLFDHYPLLNLLLNANDYDGENTGTIDQAVISHAVPSFYSSYGVTGVNSVLGRPIRIGVISDSDTNLSASQNASDLPPLDTSTYGTGTTSSVTEVIDDTQSPAANQNGTAISGVDGEGTAMMEIIHDMAPGAKLFFASADYSEAQFAKNILLLRFKYHCDIIVDDVGYFDEAVFSDGVVAQAVNRVADDGCMYFSAAGNEGHLSAYSYPNQLSGSGGETGGMPSATWEGDYASGGTVTKIGSSNVTGSVHAFNSGTKNPYSSASYGQTYSVDVFPQANYNTNIGYVLLEWADVPTGAKNDYDLYITNSGGTSTYYSATTTQNGSAASIPFEIGIAQAGYRLYILKKNSANPLALHLTTYGTEYADAPSMQFSTTGTSFGHPTTANGFGVAAVPATTNSSYAAYNPNAGSAFQTNNTSNSFSSDGPRTIFYNVTGGPNLTNAVAPTGYTLPLSTPTYSAIGTGLFSGTNSVRMQPFLSAANGVNAGTTANFSPFFGTSAAAPHAASIAGLVMSYAATNAGGVSGLTVNGGLLSVSEMHSVLGSGVLDIESSGYDVTTGYGIVMPSLAMQYLLNFLTTAPVSTPTDTTASITWTTNLPANSTVYYGTTQSLGSSVTSSTATSSHSVALTGLSPNTTYFYKIASATASGAVSYTDSSVRTFVTTSTTQPNLALGTVSAANSGSITTMTIPIVNNGGASSDVQVTSASLGSGNTTTTLPVDLGALGAGATKTATLVFPQIASGTRTVLRLTVTDGTGAVSSFSLRVTIP